MKFIKIFIITLLLVLLGGILLLIVSSGRTQKAAKDAIENAAEAVKDKAAETAAKQLEPVLEDQLSVQLEKAGVPAEVTEQVLDSISQEDKEELTKVVIKNADKLQQATDYIRDSDLGGLTEYLHENLDEGDLEAVQGLLDKYGDSLIPGMQDLPALPKMPELPAG